jgi:hypothetical protein
VPLGGLPLRVTSTGGRLPAGTRRLGPTGTARLSTRVNWSVRGFRSCNLCNADAAGTIALGFLRPVTDLSLLYKKYTL